MSVWGLLVQVFEVETDDPPCSFFRQSIGFKPDRIQCPVSAQEPIRLLRPLHTLSTVSGSSSARASGGRESLR